MQDDESKPEQTSRVTAVNSYNWRRTAIAVVITALITGTSGYLLGIRCKQSTPTSQSSPSPQSTIITQISPTIAQFLLSNPLLRTTPQPTAPPTPAPTQPAEIISQSSPTTDNTTTVIIQDDYFFKATIPHEYSIIKGGGDYIRYVTDRNGEKIIGFYISSGLGESLQTGQTVIDGVPFTVEGEINTYNRGAISCSANLYATNAQFKLGHLYFGIYTWCKDIHEEQSDVYEQVIRSIQFSEDLRAVLLGKSPPPMLRY